MLKIKINKTENKGISYTPIHISSIIYNKAPESLSGEINICSSVPHFFKNGEKAYLIRTDGNVYFQETVDVIRKNEYEFSFKYKDWVEVYSYGAVGQDNGTIFLFNSTIPLASNRSDVHIPYSCKNDDTHYEINDIYIYKIIEGANVNDNLFIEKGIEIEGEKYDVIIPVIKNGHDDEHAIFVPGYKFSKELKPQFLSIKIRNEKFFHFNNGEITINEEKWNLNSGIYNGSGDIEIKLPFSESFGTNLNQDDAFGANYVNSEIENVINPIIDYEKKVFIPVYIGEDNKLKDVESITYNLHFRQRIKQTVSKETSIYEYPIYDDWKTDDDHYWNNYSAVTNEKVLRPSVNGLSSDMADILGYLGFTDEDVYYQRNALKKSFLRISVYDTPYRETQNLLFYSTMFMNVGELHGKFLHNISNGYDPKNHFVMDNGIGEANFDRICASFKVANKYNYNFPSEGFYLHLFSSILDTAKSCSIKGYEDFKKLYLKIEFNHAKYGYTVPMSFPHNSDRIIEPTETEFPIDYMVKDEEVYYIDMSRVFSDMYVEILIKYDETANRYVWTFSPALQTGNSNMVINLFEPRINGKKQDS